jgi:hypothetical protein
MRTISSVLVVAAVALCAQPAAVAQRHNAGSSPPTAPPAAHSSGAQPIVAASSGLGALQFAAVNYGVPPPQALTRQLEDTDDRTRAASLAAIGAPGQYLEHGHIPYPHSIQLNFVALGTGDELDAILTVELDQHIVSAILLPQDGNWRRIATMLYATPFSDAATTPSSFLRIDRSLLQQEHYRAIFHAVTPLPGGDFAENEAHLRVLNHRAVITISFVDGLRSCANSHGRPGCEIIQRWLQPDPTDPAHRLLLVTASGRLPPSDATAPLAASTQFQQAHLRSFACQPFVFSDITLHYEPIANSAPCIAARPDAAH